MSVPVVYDTMLFFQAASQPNRTRTGIEAIRDGRLILCVSADLIAEVRDVLSRPEYRAKFPALEPDRVTAFLDDLLAKARLFDQVPRVFTWPQHPDDDHVFNLAIHAKAKYLVTWETRILKLATARTSTTDMLRQLAPELAVITPQTLADVLRRTPGVSSQTIG